MIDEGEIGGDGLGETIEQFQMKASSTLHVSQNHDRDSEGDFTLQLLPTIVVLRQPPKFLSRRSFRSFAATTSSTIPPAHDNPIFRLPSPQEKFKLCAPIPFTTS